MPSFSSIATAGSYAQTNDRDNSISQPLGSPYAPETNNPLTVRPASPWRERKTYQAGDVVTSGDGHNYIALRAISGGVGPATSARLRPDNQAWDYQAAGSLVMRPSSKTKPGLGNASSAAPPSYSQAPGNQHATQTNRPPEFRVASPWNENKTYQAGDVVAAGDGRDYVALRTVSGGMGPASSARLRPDHQAWDYQSGGPPVIQPAATTTKPDVGNAPSVSPPSQSVGHKINPAATYPSWNANKTYQAGDVITAGDGNYVALKAVSGGYAPTTGAWLHIPNHAWRKIPNTPVAPLPAPLTSLVLNPGRGYRPGNPSSTSVQPLLPNDYDKSLAVFQVSGPYELGTAFRLGKGNRFITNSHVIPIDPDARHSYSLRAGFEAKSNQDGDKPPIVVKVGQVLFRDKHVDVVVFTVAPSDFQSGMLEQFGYLGLSTDRPIPGTPIFAPNHAGGGPKQIALSDERGQPGQVVISHGDFIKTNLPLRPGASGSPYLGLDGRVIGIHNEGGGQGHTMLSIWPRIAPYFENTIPQSSPPHVSGVPRDNWLPPLSPSASPSRWNAAKQYEIGDYVYLDGRSYRALSRNLGSASPPAYFSSAWMMVGNPA
jgi:chitodextrinase